MLEKYEFVVLSMGISRNLMCLQCAAQSCYPHYVHILIPPITLHDNRGFAGVGCGYFLDYAYEPRIITGSQGPFQS